MEISDHFSKEKCDQAVRDVLAATDIRKLLPNVAEECAKVECGQESRCLDRGRSLSVFIKIFVHSNCVHLTNFPWPKGMVGWR